MDLWLLLSFSCHCSYILMGGCAGWSSLLLALGFPHKFVCACSSLFVRASSQVTSGGCSSLSSAEAFLSTCGEGNFPSFGGGILCHWGQWLLSCFCKGLGGFSLAALGSGVSQSLWYVWDSSPDVVCRLFSTCGELHLFN